MKIVIASVSAAVVASLLTLMFVKSNEYDRRLSSVEGWQLNLAADLADLAEIRGEYTSEKHKRNAQVLASVLAAGEAAGVDFVIEGSLEKTVANIVKGKTMDGGPFDGAFFGASKITEEEQKNALEYLELEGRMLVYRGSN